MLTRFRVPATFVSLLLLLGAVPLNEAEARRQGQGIRGAQQTGMVSNNRSAVRRWSIPVRGLKRSSRAKPAFRRAFHTAGFRKAGRQNGRVRIGRGGGMRR